MMLQIIQHLIKNRKQNLVFCLCVVAVLTFCYAHRPFTLRTWTVGNMAVDLKWKQIYEGTIMTVNSNPASSILPTCSNSTEFEMDVNITTLELLENEISGLDQGGIHRSPQGAPRLAIIVPFRKRENHLPVFLVNMHRFLQMQTLSYAIFVIHQLGDKQFNRGALLNVGYLESGKIWPSNCFFLHDVDLIPESGNLSYCCSNDSVKHYASRMSTFNYEMPYRGFVGGVAAVSSEQMQRFNGFPNRFWGWGGEDDEFGRRIHLSGQKLTHVENGRYFMFRHGRDPKNEPNPHRREQLNRAHEMWQKDGLNSLNYTVESVAYHKYYVEIQVKL